MKIPSTLDIKTFIHWIEPFLQVILVTEGIEFIDYVLGIVLRVLEVIEEEITNTIAKQNTIILLSLTFWKTIYENPPILRFIIIIYIVLFFHKFLGKYLDSIIINKKNNSDQTIDMKQLKSHAKRWDFIL